LLGEGLGAGENWRLGKSLDIFTGLTLGAPEEPRPELPNPFYGFWHLGSGSGVRSGGGVLLPPLPSLLRRMTLWEDHQLLWIPKAYFPEILEALWSSAGCP